MHKNAAKTVKMEKAASFQNCLFIRHTPRFIAYFTIDPVKIVQRMVIIYHPPAPIATASKSAALSCGA
jgi:hypothetical protein